MDDEKDGARGPVCVSSLNVLMLVQPDGRIQAKIENWAADDTAREMLANALSGVSDYLRSQRKTLIHKPTLVGLPKPPTH